MSSEESVFFDSEYIQQMTAEGTPLYDKAQNLMLPRDSYLKPMCAGSTTSKTTPSYDSKFDTTADQTTRYKEQQPNLHNESVVTTNIQIKPDDEIPPPKYHDRDRTCNTTSPSNKIDDTTSRPVSDLNDDISPQK